MPRFTIESLTPGDHSIIITYAGGTSTYYLHPEEVISGAATLEISSNGMFLEREVGKSPIRLGVTQVLKEQIESFAGVS